MMVVLCASSGSEVTVVVAVVVVVADLEKNQVNSEILVMHIWRKRRVNYDKFEIAKNCINQIFNLNAFLFFLLTGGTGYYHTIYLVFTYFSSFTDYEDDIFEVINLGAL